MLFGSSRKWKAEFLFQVRGGGTGSVIPWKWRMMKWCRCFPWENSFHWFLRIPWCENYSIGFSNQSLGFVLSSCHESVSSSQLSLFAERMQYEPSMTAVGWGLLPRRQKKRQREKHPLRVLTSAHHRYKWTIKLMEPGGQSTCSANIFTKLSGSQLQEIPLHHAEQYLILSSSAEADQKDQAGGLLIINMSNRYNNLHSQKLSKHEVF